MRTRNVDASKSTPTTKKTPPARKSATKTPPVPSAPQAGSSAAAAPKSAEVKRTSAATKAKQAKATEPAVDEAKAAADAIQVTPETKTGSGTRTVRKMVKKTVVKRKAPASAKAASRSTPKSGEAGKQKVEEESTKKKEVEDLKDVGSAKEEEQIFADIGDSIEKEECAVENVEESKKVDEIGASAEEHTEKEKEAGNDAQPLIDNVGNEPMQEDTVATDVVESLEKEEPSTVKEEEEAKEEMQEANIIEDIVEPMNESVIPEEEGLEGEAVPPEEITLEKRGNEEGNPPEDIKFEKGGLEGEDISSKEDMNSTDEKVAEHGVHEVHEELDQEDPSEDNLPVHDEEAKALEEEHAELVARAQERKIKKELEIFVGGLERDATEEDLKKVFKHVGEVVEVRLHKDHSGSKNKGYAFVKFATKEQASRALSEMKNPVICGKRCGTAPSEDNDTLFLGNICNTWTKEAIKQKLKEYGIGNVQNITLVADPQHAGLSRGFSFLEFSCHADAMLAYKRLQKPDVIFGHAERTAKIAFAEPLHEPDPEVMSQVKSVFVDGLPPHWDEDRVRDIFKGYGEIERIMLARNMSTAKRRDFGFVDFTTHEAAVACIDDVNTREFGDGKSKTKVRTRLSNPLPKTQAVKGGMCGGFRIGHGGGGLVPKFGRAYGQGVQSFSRPNFQHGRGSYQHGPDLGGLNPPFRGRQNFGQGARWGPLRGAHQASGGGRMPARSNLDRPRHGADRGHGRYMPHRGQPFYPEEEFNGPFLGRHFDDPYFYDDTTHGTKRPLFTDRDPDYMESRGVRPRLDYAGPSGTRYQDTYGAVSDYYSRDYYGSDLRGSDLYHSVVGSFVEVAVI
ncbi:hypothetical protein RJ639_011689 [Escallonia herrerae]|uniref:RRM domain-containing protein n=1 Tax=Escallonia herrerae TaxID=1293975 RepID=A0AA88VM33_9ASTE|nr:hypothetical protein RJ639_011689 [Escallonia herrerae]